MREIVILSGKGGTGKTSIAASLSFIAGEQAVIADCDVDAADLHMILRPDIFTEEDIYSGVRAEIDNTICNKCRLCIQVCRFAAVTENSDVLYIDPVKCEGCGYCYHVCPESAINLKEQMIGKLYHSHIRAASVMIHAKLAIGADNSGKLVARVKKTAQEAAEKNGNEFIIVDGSPGIGCPVISSISGADYVLIITEPTRSALQDMKRVWELSRKFRVPAGCLINKADLNPGISEDVKDYMKLEQIENIGTVMYDEDFHRAITMGLSLVEFNRSKWQPRFEAIWDKLSKTKEKT